LERGVSTRRCKITGIVTVLQNQAAMAPIFTTV